MAFHSNYVADYLIPWHDVQCELVIHLFTKKFKISIRSFSQDAISLLNETNRNALPARNWVALNKVPWEGFCPVIRE